MKYINKFILASLAMIMFLLNITVTPIEAATTHTVTTKQVNSWTLNGNMYGYGTMLYVDGDIAFCLDSLKAVSTGTNSEVTASSLGLTDADVTTLSLIAWYGYRCKSSPTTTDYFLTQNLIWEYLGYPGDFASNSTYPTKASMRTKLDEIMAQVEAFDDVPSFNGKTYTANTGQTLTITDTNGVLSSLNVRTVSGATVTKSGNTLSITPDSSKTSLTIVFDRGLTAEQCQTNFIVRSGTSQPVSCCFSGVDPYVSRLTIKVNNKIDLQLAKKDPKGNLIPNTTFKLSYNSDMSDPIGSYTTGSDGKIIVEDVLIKDVYIQETSCPSNLELDSTIYKKSLVYVSTNINYFTLTNNFKKIRLQLAKKDPNGNLIANTTFKLSYNEDMSDPIGTYTTGEDGKIIVEGVDITDVYIQEISVPSNLELDSTIHKKSLVYVSTNINYFTLTNDFKKIRLQLAKKDPDGNLIPDTTFKLSYNEDMSDPIGTYTTGEDGKIIVEGIDITDVYIQEVSCPSYLTLDSTIYKKSLIYISTNINYFTLTNEWNKINLQLAKKDPDGNLIADTTFRLSYNEDMSDPIGDFTTKEDGKIIVEDVLIKDVYIQEISCPKYLKLDSTIYNKTLVDVYTNINYFTLTNEYATTSLVISKHDNLGDPVANTSFEIGYDENMQETIGTFTTGSDGMVTIDDLRIGTIYIREVYVPDHLIIDNQIYSYELEDESIHYYHAVNQLKTSSLVIYKRDSEGNFVENVSFMLSYNIDMSDPIGTYTTNSNGTVTINDLKLGDIYIQEVSGPSHIAIDSTIYSKEIVEDKITYFYLTNNVLRGDIKINKKDNYGNIVEGVTFILSNSSLMSPILGTYTTDSNGIINITDLLAGTYYLKETSVPSHVELNKSIFIVKVGGNNVTTLNVVNNLKTGDLTIHKTDNKGNSLKDVTFLISYNSDMSNPIGQYTTDSSGLINLYYLKAGTIYIQEIDVDDQYILDSSIHEAEISYNHTTSIELVNKIKTYTLSISKEVEGVMSDSEQSFDFTITLDDTSINGLYGDVDFVDGIGEFSLKHNETIDLYDLPYLVSYTIEEVKLEDYDVFVQDTEVIQDTVYTGVLSDDHHILYRNVKKDIVPTSVRLNNQYSYIYLLIPSLFYILIKKVRI